MSNIYNNNSSISPMTRLNFRQKFFHSELHMGTTMQIILCQSCGEPFYWERNQNVSSAIQQKGVRCPYKDCYRLNVVKEVLINKVGAWKMRSGDRLTIKQNLGLNH